MTVGESIRIYRKKANLTQKKLGELCGISEAMIRQYELGIRKPKYETLSKIATQLDIHPLVLNGSISEDFANQISNNIGIYEIFNDIYGKIDIRNVINKNGDKIYYYVLGEDDSNQIAISELTFDNIEEDIYNLIENRVNTEYTTINKQINECHRILNNRKPVFPKDQITDDTGQDQE